MTITDYLNERYAVTNIGDLEWTVDNYEYYEYGSVYILGLAKHVQYHDIVVIPDKIYDMDVVAIAEEAFCEDEFVKEIYLPESVKYIDTYAFEGCIRLEHIELPNGLKSIGKYAFSNCDNLEMVTVPRGCYINPQAFDERTRVFLKD